MSAIARLEEVYGMYDDGTIGKMDSKELVPLLVEVAAIIVGKMDKFEKLCERQMKSIYAYEDDFNEDYDEDDYEFLEDELNSLKFDINDDVSFFEELKGYLGTDDAQEVEEKTDWEFNLHYLNGVYRDYKSEFAEHGIDLYIK